MPLENVKQMREPGVPGLQWAFEIVQSEKVPKQVLKWGDKESVTVDIRSLVRKGTGFSWNDCWLQLPGSQSKTKKSSSGNTFGSSPLNKPV